MSNRKKLAAIKRSATPPLDDVDALSVRARAARSSDDRWLDELRRTHLPYTANADEASQAREVVRRDGRSHLFVADVTGNVINGGFMLTH